MKASAGLFSPEKSREELLLGLYASAGILAALGLQPLNYIHHLHSHVATVPLCPSLSSSSYKHSGHTGLGPTLLS